MDLIQKRTVLLIKIYIYEKIDNNKLFFNKIETAYALNDYINK